MQLMNTTKQMTRWLLVLASSTCALVSCADDAPDRSIKLAERPAPLWLEAHGGSAFVSSLSKIEELASGQAKAITSTSGLRIRVDADNVYMLSIRDGFQTMVAVSRTTGKETVIGDTEGQYGVFHVDAKRIAWCGGIVFNGYGKLYVAPRNADGSFQPTLPIDLGWNRGCQGVVADDAGMYLRVYHAIFGEGEIVFRPHVFDGTGASEKTLAEVSVGGIAQSFFQDESGVYFDEIGHYVIRVDKVTGARSEIPNVTVPFAFDGSTFFWGSGARQSGECKGTLSKMPKGGGAPEVLSGHQCEVLAIAVDDTNVYWADRPFASEDSVPSSIKVQAK